MSGGIAATLDGLTSKVCPLPWQWWDRWTFPIPLPTVRQDQNQTTASSWNQILYTTRYMDPPHNCNEQLLTTICQAAMNRRHKIVQGTKKGKGKKIWLPGNTKKYGFIINTSSQGGMAYMLTKKDCMQQKHWQDNSSTSVMHALNQACFPVNPTGTVVL